MPEPMDIDAILQELGPESTALEHWVDLSAEPSINHPAVRACSGGGMVPEQHYGILKDGRVFYLRYKYGRASMQVLRRPDGVYDLPLANPAYDKEAHVAAIEANETYDGPLFWMEPYPSLKLSEDNGWFGSDEERSDVFHDLLFLVNSGWYWWDDGTSGVVTATMCFCGDNQPLRNGRYQRHVNSRTNKTCPPLGTYPVHGYA